VAQNDAEAAKWYKMAADQGVAGAQNNLGIMYVQGRGVGQDYALAHMWFDLAAGQGVDAAAKNRHQLTPLMNPAQIAEAQRLAREWKPRK
jgi:TPR repeat protein